MTALSIRLPPDLKAWLVAKAKTEGRSMTMQLNQLIKAAMAAETQETAQ